MGRRGHAGPTRAGRGDRRAPGPRARVPREPPRLARPSAVPPRRGRPRRTMLQDVEAKATARGDEITRGDVLWRLAFVQWLAGRWQVRRSTSWPRRWKSPAQTQDPRWARGCDRPRARRWWRPTSAWSKRRASLAEDRSDRRSAGSLADEVFTSPHCLGARGRLELALREPGGRGRLPARAAGIGCSCRGR